MLAHSADLWSAGDSVTDTVAAASTAILLPLMDAGDTGVPGATAVAKRYRISTDSLTGVWFKTGRSTVAVSAAGDASDSQFVIAYESVIVITSGDTHIAHFGTAGDFIIITPLNN